MPQLAIAGGDKLLTDHPTPFVHPIQPADFYDQFKDRQFRLDTGAFDSALITTFQQRAQEYFGQKYILPTNSGTSALYELYYAAGLQPGDEVIVPAYTFFATASPLIPLGCRPILADCLANGNIDPVDVEKRITSKTKAIVVTHMWGIPCDMDALSILATKHEILLLEDASHAHGATYNGKMAGSFGIGAAWSLGAQKLMTGGQGGMLGTNDAELFQRAVLVGHANNKRKKEITLEHLLPYDVAGLGYNLRMHPYSAALLTSQLAVFDRTLTEKQEVATYLAKEIGAHAGLELPRIPEGATASWYGFPILYNQSAMHDITRETFVEALLAEGADGFDIPNTTRPLTSYPLFADGGAYLTPGTRPSKPLLLPDMYPQAELFQSRIIKLPVWYGPDRLQHAERHIAALRKVVTNLDELSTVQAAKHNA